MFEQGCWKRDNLFAFVYNSWLHNEIIVCIPFGIACESAPAHLDVVEESSVKSQNLPEGFAFLHLHLYTGFEPQDIFIFKLILLVTLHTITFGDS